MGYTYTDPVALMAYSARQGVLLCVYSSSDIQAWDPYTHRVIYHLENGHETLMQNYPITSIQVKDEKNQFFTGAANGSIQIRLTRTGRLLDELFMTSGGNKEAAQGRLEVKLTEEINDQIIVGGSHGHIVQYDLHECAHRSEWAHPIRPLLFGIMHAPNLLVSLHENGDLIYWRVAYKKRWVALNVHDRTVRHRHTLSDMMRGAGGETESNTKLKSTSHQSLSEKSNDEIWGRQRSGQSSEDHDEQVERDSVDVDAHETRLKEEGKEKRMTTGGGGGEREGGGEGRREKERGRRGGREGEEGGGERGTEKERIKDETKKGVIRERIEHRPVDEENKETQNAENQAHDFRAFIFLKKNRAIFFNEKVGNLLLVRSRSDFVECWNMYGFVAQFPVRRAACRLGNTTCAIVDPDERFLFLGSNRGYVRTYYIENYQNPGADTTRLSRVRLRAIFPFLWKSLHKTVGDRVKNPANESSEVPLVNTYRAHMAGITCLEFLTGKQVLVTAGQDKIVRLWHLSGSFLSALGACADARDIPARDVGLFTTLLPPYFLPTFMRRYPQGVGLCTRKVLLREWQKTYKKVPVGVMANMYDVPRLEDLLAKARDGSCKTTWNSDSQVSAAPDSPPLSGSQLDDLVPTTLPQLSPAQWKQIELKIHCHKQRHHESSRPAHNSKSKPNINRPYQLAASHKVRPSSNVTLSHKIAPSPKATKSSVTPGNHAETKPKRNSPHASKPSGQRQLPDSSPLTKPDQKKKSPIQDRSPGFSCKKKQGPHRLSDPRTSQRGSTRVAKSRRSLLSQDHLRETESPDVEDIIKEIKSLLGRSNARANRKLL